MASNKGQRSDKVESVCSLVSCAALVEATGGAMQQCGVVVLHMLSSDLTLTM